MSGCDGGTDGGDRDKLVARGPDGAQRNPGPMARRSRITLSLHPGYGTYFLAGGCGWDGGTVSISLPENTGDEVGWPLGEPPACSTVTA